MAKGRSLRPEMLTDDIAGQLKLYHQEASAQGLSLPEYALRWILQQQYFQKMNDLYEKGDAALKNAVENVFIYSLDSLTFSCKAVRRQEIFSMLSLSLNKKYLHQVYKSGL